MPTPEALPLRWFIFKMPGSAFPYGSLSRTETEALDEVQEGLRRRRQGTKRTTDATPNLTRDTAAEARANAALLSHAKASA